MTVFSRRSLMAGTAATLASPFLARAAESRVLRFVPHANLTTMDPVWSTALITRNHGYLVYDTLYSAGEDLTPQPQMAAGHTIEDNGRRWTISLRAGLRFHDGEPVRAGDVVASIRRWGRRDPFGQTMLAAVAEMVAVDDSRLVIRLHRPFPRLLDAMAKPSPMFVMPERIAQTEPSVAITDPIGSGPYRFLRDTWVPGARAGYERFTDYLPRDEPARMLAGGKRAWFDRIEWHFIADPATAAAALQTGEVDWWEAPHTDLLATLAASPDIKVAQLNTFGTICALRPNHAQPPFNDPALRAALWPALKQDDVMAVVAGADRARWSDRLGYFTPGTPLANDVGMQALTGPRSLDAAKRAVETSGYQGETVIFLQPSDIEILNSTGMVMADLMRRVGLHVEQVQADWATIAQRRAKRDPVGQGGWSAFCTVLGGADCLNPGTNPLLRADGAGAFFGWPDSPKLEAERLAWFDTADMQAQQRTAEAIQRQAFQDVPYWPLGQFMQPTAYRRSMRGFISAPVPVPWNVSKVS